MKIFFLILIILILIPVSFAGYSANISFPSSLITENNKTSSDTMDLGTASNEIYDGEVGVVYFYKEEIVKGGGLPSLTKDIADKIDLDYRDKAYIYVVLIFVIAFVIILLVRKKKKKDKV